MYTIPKEFASDWEKIKKHGAEDVAKIAASSRMTTPEQKAEIIATYKKVVANFDQGLKPKMRAAATAKDDATARKAAREVAAVASQYLKAVDAIPEGTIGRQGFQVMWGNFLRRVLQHAEASMKSRAPIEIPHKEIEVKAKALEKAFLANSATVPPASKEQYGILAMNLREMFNGSAGRLRMAKSEAEALAQAGRLVDNCQWFEDEVTKFVKKAGRQTVPIATATGPKLAEIHKMAVTLQTQLKG